MHVILLSFIQFVDLCSKISTVYRKLAAIKKEEGNKLYSSQDYAGAITLYSEAIGKELSLNLKSYLHVYKLFFKSCIWNLKWAIKNGFFVIKSNICKFFSELQPTNHAYYGNRCACYLMKKEYQNALKDARISTSFNPMFTKGYLREAKCHIALGSPNVAKKCLVKALEMEHNNKQAVTDVSIFTKI